ncbi:AMP-binding protein, partial [Nocardia fluminea]|uniref:AMP-binding protein n=1 Tax=Nocardia fluminea TaxID=134984 RepID=UPI003D0DE77C
VENWAPGRRFVNAYGPTEFTVIAAMSELWVGVPVAIGTPVRGSRALVLDERLRPVVTGVQGELFVFWGGGGSGCRGVWVFLPFFVGGFFFSGTTPPATSYRLPGTVSDGVNRTL